MCHAVSEESCLGSETHKDIGGKSQGETHAVGEEPATGPGWSFFSAVSLLLSPSTYLAQS